jgi:hypothetical protein
MSSTIAVVDHVTECSRDRRARQYTVARHRRGSGGISLEPPRPLAALDAAAACVWIASSGYSCYRHWVSFGPDGWEIGESVHCFSFILSVGVSLLLLRRSRPLSPARVAAVGGLGVTALAAFLLQFFHPFDVTLMDLSLHPVAIGIVVALSALAGGFARRDGRLRLGGSAQAP